MYIKRPYFFAASLWLVMVVVFFWPVIFQGKVIAPLDILDSLLRPWATTEKIDVHNAFTYDAISQYLPYDWSVYQSLRQDGYIGWNPYVHSGTSIVENTMTCPGDWHHHLYRFLPFWSGWNLGIILQFAIAGLGMLMLLRDQKIPAAYALIGAVAFGFYSQFTLWICHRWVLGAMCWAPWILWSLLRARGKGIMVDVLSAVFISLAFRGGHLQSVLFVFLMVSFTAFHYALPHLVRKKPAEALRSLAPFVIAGILGSMLAADVLIETIPALLKGNKSMADRGFFNALKGIPTLVTSIIPTLMGSPQGLDVMKFFELDLFSIKFMGGTAMFLATLALLKKCAPSLPKSLFLVGLLLTFTPADKWLYSRFTVIFALGGSWLAAWQLAYLANQPPKPFWKNGWIVFSAIALMWALLSVGLVWKYDVVMAEIRTTIAAKLDPGKASRIDWMRTRAVLFLDQCYIWHPRNIIFIILLGLGYFGVTRIHLGHKNSQFYAILITITTFSELFLFSSTWITFSHKPPGQKLYVEPLWAKRLREEVGYGKVAVFTRQDFDYMQLNTPSAYDIRFADGYETVTPHRIEPTPANDWNPKSYAAVGISHVLVSPQRDPGSISGWDKVLQFDEYVLYRNPLFVGLAQAELVTGSKIALKPTVETANIRVFDLPSGVTILNLLESYNAGWEFSLNGSDWWPVNETLSHSIQVKFERPTDTAATRLILQYRPTYRTFYRIVIGATIIGLISFAIIRRARVKRAVSILV
jgi:hypothetical protein